MILGIDIGGTNIKFGIVNQDHRVIARHSISTKKGNGDIAIVNDIIKTCLALRQTYPFEKIGIGTPGVIDTVKGICVSAANIPYNNTPIVQMIADATGIVPVLGNDATCAVWGELYAGIGREYKDFLMVTLGTGIGGGIVIDGKVYQGYKGGAGEIGHMIIDYAGLPCPCGQIGCWEQYASVSALVEQTRQAAENAPDSMLASMCTEGITGRTPFEAAARGCPVAENVIEKFTDFVLVGIAGLNMIFQPETVVLAGAITHQEAALLEPLQRKQWFDTKICISDLKNDAGLIGAAVIAAHT